MKAKMIHTQVETGGRIHIEDPELPTGPADVIILYPENRAGPPKCDAKDLPLGGHKAGWLQPEHLRREAIYEEN